MRRIEKFGATIGAPAATLTLLAACAMGADKPISQTAADAKPNAERVVIAEAAGHGEGDGHSSATNITVTTEEGTLRLQVSEGDVEALLNGEKVPADRIDIDGGQVRILGEDGRTFAEFNLSNSDARIWVAEVGDEPPRGRVRVAAPPKRVMLGVVTAPPGEALASQLNLDRDGSLVIAQVLPELPADRAGVEQWDVIVRVDDESKVTSNRLQKIIRGKAAGDDVALSLIRKAKPKRIVVELEAVEGPAASRLFAAPRAPEPPRGWTVEESERQRRGHIEQRQRHREQVERQQRQRQRRHEADGDRHEAREHLRHLRQNREMGEELRRRIEEEVRQHLHLEKKAGKHREEIEKAMKHLREMEFDFDFNLGEGWDQKAIKQAQEEARRAIEKAMRELDDADVQKRLRGTLKKLDEMNLQEHLGRIRVQLEPLRMQLEELEDMEFEFRGVPEWRLKELPEIEFLKEDGERRVIIVAPEKPEKPEKPEQPQKRRRFNERGPASETLESLEKRLERLEQMLEKLIEQEGRRGGARHRGASEESGQQA